MTEAEQNQIFARELDQQRALAALREREHLAREMHDTVGQVLGYISMQSQAALYGVADTLSLESSSSFASFASFASSSSRCCVGLSCCSMSMSKA